MLYHHCFSTLLYNMPLGRSRKTRWDWNLMGYMIFGLCSWCESAGRWHRYCKQKNTETLIDLSKEVGLEIIVEETKCMLLARHQNACENLDIKIGNRSFKDVSQFKYLATTVTNQNLIQEEIKRRLNSGNACYCSVQNLLSSRLLSKYIEIRR
jgi:hypothetical protein